MIKHNRKNARSSAPITSDNVYYVACRSDQPSSPSPAAGSFLPDKKDEKHLMEESDLKILELHKKYHKTFSPKILYGWIKKYGSESLNSNLVLFLQASKAKTPIRNPEAWMENALKKQYAAASKLESDNVDYAKAFKKKHGWRNLKINKRYCTDTSNNESFTYNLPHKTFVELLAKYHAKSNEHNQPEDFEEEEHTTTHNENLSNLQKKALQHNQEIREYGLEKIADENEKLIRLNKMKVYCGSILTLIVINDLRTLMDDINESRKSFERMKNAKKRP